jgi:beta-lactamase superfamily II metal-dependent hydrolase
MEIHFIDVGCGNMTLTVLPDGSVLMYDCNITYDNKVRVLSYIRKIIGTNNTIDIFINSHRDADHMRGIRELHTAHTIKEIWDSGVPGTTTNSLEYKTYMNFRCSVTSREIAARRYWTYGNAKLRCMNSKRPDYREPNEQSIVMKIEYMGSSVMLSGDTTYRPWKEKILPFYSPTDLKSSIFLAPHHGSLSFFDDPSDSSYYYTSHIERINPAMTLISVGPNVNSLPDAKAIEFYRKYSRGSNKGNKVYTTENKGTMKLVLKEDGGWSLNVNQ